MVLHYAAPLLQPLAKLTRFASDGFYCVGPGPPSSAFVKLQRHALRCSKEEFEQLWSFSESVARTPNPFGGGTYLKRKQATFGHDTYRFGAQCSHGVNTPAEQWPSVVQRVLLHARTQVAERIRDNYNAVHANWYPDGTAGIMPHADDEESLFRRMPILSYTFLSEPGNTRDFTFYESDGKTTVASIALDHGDLLVMAGDIQERYKHGLKPTSAKSKKHLRRINLTVRAFRSSLE